MLLASALIDARQVPASSAPRNPNATTAGELVVEPPTLINLGFEWFIQGDANRNAAVQVSFRRQGTTGWTPGLPLLRLGGERVYAESRVDVVAPDMFAGSVLDLQPDTAYEVRLALSNPDGTKAIAERTLLRAHARRAAALCRRARLSRLSARLQGRKIEPAFEGLMCAYNFWCAGTDWATAGRPRVRPGDTILVHAGIYNTTATSTRTTPRSIAPCRSTAPTT